MKPDDQILKDVMEQLKWLPYFETAEIDVAVKKGIVTLFGINKELSNNPVVTFYKKLAVERAAEKIDGVKAVRFAY